jgi:hypothetical protein
MIGMETVQEVYFHWIMTYLQEVGVELLTSRCERSRHVRHLIDDENLARYRGHSVERNLIPRYALSSLPP